jgi:DNA (cytosine-5)-methyltransferase 1
MRYLAVCSGIEAVSVAWRPLGWQPAMFAEIDPFCCWLLRSRYGGSRPVHMPCPSNVATRQEAIERAAAIRNVIAIPTTGAVLNFGDFTRIGADDVGAIDLLAGGTPCQSFSVAGKRAGLGDPRGNLTIEFARLADRLRPFGLVWENVPGILSIDDGRTFGAFLGMLVQLGYGIAYRVLDAQYFGVPQRRRRIFVVGYLGDWRGPAAVFLEWHSLSGYPPPRRQARKDIAPTLSARAHGGGGPGSHFDIDGGLVRQFAFGGNNSAGPIDVATAINACGTASRRIDFETETFVAHSLYADGFDASEDGSGRGNPLVPIAIYAPDPQTKGVEMHESIAFNLRGRGGGAMPKLAPAASVRAGTGGGTNSYVAFSAKDYGADVSDIAPTLRSMGHDASHPNAGGQLAIAFSTNERGEVRERPIHKSLNGSQSGKQFDGVIYGTPSSIPSEASCGKQAENSDRSDGARDLAQSVIAVRRLTPRECERLQGFPDDYTLVEYRGKTASDGPRYKALGNSMAVPVMRWLGERIAALHQIVTLRAS